MFSERHLYIGDISTNQSADTNDVYTKSIAEEDIKQTADTKDV